MPPPPERRPRLAVDLRALVPAPTGIGVYTVELVRRLAAGGRFEVVGMAHAPVRDGGALAGAGARLEVQRAPLGLLWQQWRLPRRLRRGDVDLLWSPVLTLPWRLPVPGVVTVHDLTTLHFPRAHRLKVRLSVRPFLRRTLSQARRVVTLSEAAAADLRRHFPGCADRLRVVPPGVDDAFRPASPDEAEAIRREVGCADGYLLYAGTVEPRKDVAALVTAWEGLRRADPSTPPLVVAGPYGWKSRRLERRLAGLAPLGLVRTGRVERRRLVRLFQGATAFVFPSLYEGFGLPVAEAMACAVPVVVSDTASLQELVGEAGVVSPAGDAGALAEALRSLLASPERAGELARAGRERIAPYTWERAAAGIEEVFEEALAPGDAGRA